MTTAIQTAINDIFDVKVPKLFIYDAANTEISWLLPNLGSWFGSLL
jgi:hypothetical protein